MTSAVVAGVLLLVYNIGLPLFIRRITTGKNRERLDHRKFETFVAERASAVQRLADAGMQLPEPFVALCLLLGLSACSRLQGLASMYAVDEAVHQDGQGRITTETVTAAARQMLQVSSQSNTKDDESSLRVLTTEVRRIIKSEMTAVNAANATQPPSRPAPTYQDGCFYCNKNGHRAFNCQKLKSEFSSLSQEDQAKWGKYVTRKMRASGVNAVATTEPKKGKKKSTVTDLL